MNVTLCEECWPTLGHEEVLTVNAVAPCAKCRRHEIRSPAGLYTLRCNVFARDPRPVRQRVPMVELVQPEPPPTIEASAFEIAMRGLAIIRDGAGKTTDLGDGEGPVLLDVEAIADLADSFIALALKVAKDAQPISNAKWGAKARADLDAGKTNADTDAYIGIAAVGAGLGL